MHRCKACSGSSNSFVLLASLAVAQVLALGALTGTAVAQVEPGDKISRENVEKITELAPPGVRWAVENGMDMDIIPYKKIPIPKA